MRAPTEAIRRRKTDLAWAGGGLGGVLLAGSFVEPDTVSAFELAVFRVFNDAPGFLYPVVWPLMQYGTFITIPTATVVALLFRKVRLAIEMGVAGVAVYGLAKLAKDAFPRGRPGAVLAEANLRGVPARRAGVPLRPRRRVGGARVHPVRLPARTLALGAARARGDRPSRPDVRGCALAA